MRITNDFEVAQPIDTVWRFFDDIPGVAACLPGTQLTAELGDDRYAGQVAIRMGPVKLEFDGTAEIVARDDATRTLVVDAAGADQKGRGHASMLVNAGLVPTARGTRVDVGIDLQLSGAAAQYGRGMVSDVTAVLIRDFAANMQQRIEAVARGVPTDQLAATSPASGLGVAAAAMRLALGRVARRFLLPYRPAVSIEGADR